MESSEERPLNTDEASIHENVILANYDIENSSAIDGEAVCVQYEGPTGSCYFMLPEGVVFDENEGVLVYMVNPDDHNNPDAPTDPDDKGGSTASAVQDPSTEESLNCIEVDMKNLEGVQVQVKNSDGELVNLSLVPDQLAEFAEIATANIAPSDSQASNLTSDTVNGSDLKADKTASASEKPAEVKLAACSSDPQVEGTVLTSKEDESESTPVGTEPTPLCMPKPVDNTPQVVHSPISCSSQPADNTVSVIHAVACHEEEISKRSSDSEEVSLKSPLVDSVQLTTTDLSESISKDDCSLTDSSAPSEEENFPTDVKLLNQEDKSISHESSTNESKDTEMTENGIGVNGSEDVENDEMEVDMNETDSSPVPADQKLHYGEESCNGTENCPEVPDCSEDRIEDDSNHSDVVSSHSSHVDNAVKEDHLSNSSFQNADCSETDVDTKMDVDQDMTSMEDETCNSKFSDKELVISENSCGLKDINEHENSNGLQVIEEQNSFRNIPDLKNSNSVPSALPSEDSQSQDDVRDPKSTQLLEKPKSDEYEFDSGSNHSDNQDTHSEASLPKENIDSQNSKPESLSNQEKVDDLKLTFLGALDTTDTTVMKQTPFGCPDADAVEDHKSSDSFHTFGSVDETKSLSNSSPLVSENPVNGNLIAAHLDNVSEDKVSSDKDLEGVTEASSMEEITVKVPKKTYLMKRRMNLLKVSENGQEREKTSSPLNSYLEEASPLFDSTDEPAPKRENSIDEQPDLEDDFFSDLKNRVSATYKRKRKSKVPLVQPIRIKSLRPRYSQSLESLENGTAQAEVILNGIVQKEAEKDDESVHWGDYLSRTSFQTVQKDEPPVTTTRKKRVMFSSLAENNRLSWYKNRIKSGKQWDKLIKSSPCKVKTHGIDKRKLREKIKRQSLSLLNSKKFKLQLNKSIDSKKRGRPKKLNSVPAVHLVSKVVKRCNIRYLGDSSDADSKTLTKSKSSQNTECFFNCLNCDFATDSPNIISRHFVLCCQTHKNKAKIDYSVNDMAKQRIRGENSKDDEVPRNSRTTNEIYHESEDDDSRKALNTAHTFKPKEVVWAELKKRFWPALLWELEDSNAFVYLITSNEGFKLPVNRLKSFNDSERNKRYLEEAENLPNSDDFVKAVQISNSYARKLTILNESVDAKDFFNIPEDVKFLSDIDCNTSSTDSSSASSAIIEEVLDSSPEKLDEFDMEALELSVVDDVVDCIENGKCDDHVVGIFRKKIASERHKMHQQLLNKRNAEIASRLKDMSWFGPFKSDSTMQMRLYDYLYDLFKKKVGNESKKSKEEMISYIYEVWIPEAIIKAISVVKDTTLDEAEIIFYKQETRSASFGMEVDS